MQPPSNGTKGPNGTTPHPQSNPYKRNQVQWGRMPKATFKVGAAGAEPPVAQLPPRATPLPTQAATPRATPPQSPAARPQPTAQPRGDSRTTIMTGALVPPPRRSQLPPMPSVDQALGMPQAPRPTPAPGPAPIPSASTPPAPTAGAPRLELRPPQSAAASQPSATPAAVQPVLAPVGRTTAPPVRSRNRAPLVIGGAIAAVVVAALGVQAYFLSTRPEATSAGTSTLPVQTTLPGPVAENAAPAVTAPPVTTAPVAVPSVAQASAAPAQPVVAAPRVERTAQAAPAATASAAPRPAAAPPVRTASPTAAPARPAAAAPQPAPAQQAQPEAPILVPTTPAAPPPNVAEPAIRIPQPNPDDPFTTNPINGDGGE